MSLESGGRRSQGVNKIESRTTSAPRVLRGRETDVCSVLADVRGIQRKRRRGGTTLVSTQMIAPSTPTLDSQPELLSLQRMLVLCCCWSWHTVIPSTPASTSSPAQKLTKINGRQSTRCILPLLRLLSSSTPDKGENLPELYFSF